MSSGNPSSGNRSSSSGEGYYEHSYSEDSHNVSSYRVNYRGRGRGGYRGRGGDYYGGRGGYSNRFNPYYGSRGGRGGYSSSYQGGRDMYRTDKYETWGNNDEASYSEESASRTPENMQSNGYNDNNNSPSYRGGYRGRAGYGRGRGGYYSHHNTYAYGSQSFDNENTHKQTGAASPSTKQKTSQHRESKASQAKTFNNPWVTILQIKDDTTQNALESRHDELEKVNKEVVELQRARLQLENVVNNLERQAAREELHVRITNEKLEEFTYL